MANFNNELNNYQNIPRSLIFDNTLSDRARFVFCFMASKPNGWEFFLEPMAKEIGYSVETLRKYINELVDSGWLEKGEQKKEKGMFGATEYTLKAVKSPSIKKPCTEITVSEKIRVGENPTLNKIDNKQKQDNKEKEINKSISKKKFNFKQALIDLGIDEHIVDDWLLVRKNKKATNSETAFNAIKKQIELSGASANDCITLSVEHSWAGFKAEWYNNIRSNDETLFNQNKDINTTNGWQMI